KERTGRIFLDYLRNDRMATAVAPLSPRGRPGAPVSMPLSWSQVKRGLDPTKYTVRTVPALVKKLTAWEDYCDGERPWPARSNGWVKSDDLFAECDRGVRDHLPPSGQLAFIT